MSFELSNTKRAHARKLEKGGKATWRRANCARESKHNEAQNKWKKRYISETSED